MALLQQQHSAGFLSTKHLWFSLEDEQSGQTVKQT
jgi:hypothetical protein